MARTIGNSKMKKSIMLYLFLSGLTLIAVGSFISFTPSFYLAQFIQTSELSADILSEMRGMGGTMSVFGLFILVGSFKTKLTKTALSMSILIFSSFFVFRCVGIVVDGMPNNAILAALGLEMVFAGLGITLWLNRRLP
jgi:hypothetical protein